MNKTFLLLVKYGPLVHESLQKCYEFLLSEGATMQSISALSSSSDVVQNTAQQVIEVFRLHHIEYTEKLIGSNFTVEDTRSWYELSQSQSLILVGHAGLGSLKHIINNSFQSLPEIAAAFLKPGSDVIFRANYCWLLLDDRGYEFTPKNNDTFLG